jgi:hypothetical protein
MVGYRISTRQSAAIVAAQVQNDGLISIRYSHAHISISETGYVVNRSVDSLQLLNLTTGGGWGFYDTLLVHQLNYPYNDIRSLSHLSIRQGRCTHTGPIRQSTGRNNETEDEGGGTVSTGGNSNLDIHCGKGFETTLLNKSHSLLH